MRQPTGEELFTAIKSGFNNGYTPWAGLLDKRRLPWEKAASDLVEVASWETKYGAPVHPSAEMLYIMIVRNNESGYFPFMLASESAKASYQAAAMRFYFHPDTLMAQHGASGEAALVETLLLMGQKQ